MGLWVPRQDKKARAPAPLVVTPSHFSHISQCMRGGTQGESICGSARHSDPVPFSPVEGTADHASGSHMDEQTRRSRELRGWVASLQNVNADCGNRCHHRIPSWHLALALVSMAGTHSVGGRD